MTKEEKLTKLVDSLCDLYNDVIEKKTAEKLGGEAYITGYRNALALIKYCLESEKILNIECDAMGVIQGDDEHDNSDIQ